MSIGPSGVFYGLHTNTNVEIDKSLGGAAYNMYYVR